MAIDHKIWNFPITAIQSQLFHVPGAYFDGGLTSGGARIMSPEPGGRAVLEVTPSLQVGEWDAPFSSWLMSKINGEIFRVPMVKTPQLVSFIGDKNYKLSKRGINWDNDEPWDNGQGWSDDGAYLNSSSTSLEGAISLNIETGSFGEVIRHGHVIGISNHAYMVDDIEYIGTVANIKVKPPLRKNVAIDEMIYLMPYFLGIIANGSEIRNSYDAENIGAIKLNRIIFQEVVL